MKYLGCAKDDSARFDGDKKLGDVGAGSATIETGANGLQVTKVQQALIDLGYLLPTFGVDGKFGDETKAALTTFQGDHGVTPPSGKLDAATMTALNAAYDTRKPYIDNAKDDPLKPGTRTLSADDKKAAHAAMVPPKGAAGTPPVFTEVVAGKKYGDEIRDALTTTIASFHKELYEDKAPLRADPAKNFHDWSTMEGPGKAAKQVVDAVYGSNYGGVVTYPPMTNKGAQTFRATGDNTRYNTLIEGFCDFFTLNVRTTVKPDPVLAATVEGPYANGKPPAPDKSGVYPSHQQAEQVVSVVGIKNAQAAYFQGQTKLMGA